MGKSISVVETEANSINAKMVNHIAFLGITKPEKLAEGPCPHCQTTVDLWVTGQGLELSLHGKGYEVEQLIEMDEEEYGAFQPGGRYPASNPITIESPAFFKEELSLKTKIMDFLLKSISCPINLKKTVFFIILGIASMALLTQGIDYYWPVNKEIQLISVNTNWPDIIRNLFLFLLGLIVINYIAYKADFSDSGSNQLDKWTLGSSIVIFSYCLLSGIILPLLLLSRLNIGV